MMDFTPVIQLTRVSADSVLLVFDSCLNNDTARATKVIKFPDGFLGISYELSGEGVEAEEGADWRQFSATLTFLINVSGETRRLDCAMDLRISALEKKSKRFVFASDEDILDELRAGVADAMTEAVADYMERSSGALLLVPPPAVSGGFVNANAHLPRKNAPSVWRTHWVKITATGMSVLLVVYGLLWAGGKMLSHDPAIAAVEHQMANDPNITTEQIRLTKQTLKEMGLDPGQAADTGCLTDK